MPGSALRDAGTRAALLEAAEELFSRRGFNAVSVREIVREAGVNLGAIPYHFGSKENLLLEIYRIHCGPMNARRRELMEEARRISDPQDRVRAIVRAYLLPAFSSGSDHGGGGARFTRLRAVLQAEGNEAAREVIAQTFDDTSNALVDMLVACLPHLARETIVWRCHFLLGALYYTLINPERVARLSGGAAQGGDFETAIDQLVASTAASLMAPEPGLAPSGTGQKGGRP